jgi:hypothetical protein
LQLYLFSVDVDHARPKLHANCQVMNWLKALVRELEEQATFPNTWSALNS